MWDNDWLSPDDFIGTIITNRFSFVILIYTGTIDIDLLHIPEAAKSSSECGAHQLDPNKDKKAVNLFNKKRIYGWWPVIKQANPNCPCTVRETICMQQLDSFYILREKLRWS